MASAGWDDLPVFEQMVGYEARSAEWGGMAVAFERAGKGHHPPELFRGLPDDRCPCPHWGYLVSGSIRIDYADTTETVVAGQAFYLPPGHLAVFEEDSVCVEFSPATEMAKVYDTIRQNSLKYGIR